MLRGRVVTPAGLVEDGVVAVAGGRVTYAGPAGGFSGRPGPDLDGGRGRLVLPGLVDVHNHGGGGASFSAGTAAATRAAAAEHLRRGSTSLLASVVTDRVDRMLAAVACAGAAAEAGTVAGIHVEGPFLAPGRRGAQDARQLRGPDRGLARELLAAGGGHLRVMTLAPELPGCEDVVTLLLEERVVPAVGHTEATAGRVRRTLARTHHALGRPGLVTHLFNAMPPLHHREPGAAAGALGASAAGDAYVELVADGVHLDDEVVRTVFDLLGPDRVVLVTDATAAAGMPDGEYDLGSQRVRVAGGVARLGTAGDAPLAGGTSHLLDVVRRCVEAGVDLVSAVTAASRTPAAAAGLDGAGALEAGAIADLVVTDASLRPVRVMRSGGWLAP